MSKITIYYGTSKIHGFILLSLQARLFLNLQRLFLNLQLLLNRSFHYSSTTWSSSSSMSCGSIALVEYFVQTANTVIRLFVVIVKVFQSKNVLVVVVVVLLSTSRKDSRQEFVESSESKVTMILIDLAINVDSVEHDTV